MRIGSIIGLLLLLGVAAAAYFFMSGRDVTLRFSEDDLRGRLDDQLPFTEDYLFIFNVTLDNPRVDLIEGSDRITGGVDAVLKIAGAGDLEGAVDISSGIRYDAGEAAFFLNDPEIERINIEGLTSAVSNRANQAISLALSEFYEERPIYRLSDKDMRHQATKLVLQDVVVENETLVVRLGLGKTVATATTSEDQ